MSDNFEVGYWDSSGAIVVGFFDGSSTTLPVIAGVPAVQDNAAITIPGANFSASGNKVTLGSTVLTLSSETTTQLITDAKVFVNEALNTPLPLTVTDGSGNISNQVLVSITPASDQAVFTFSSLFPGDPSTRVEGAPDLDPGDQIIFFNVQGTGGVDISHINMAPNGAVDGAASASGGPNVTDVDYHIFDGDQRSVTPGTITFQNLVTTIRPPNVIGDDLTTAHTKALAANMVDRVVASARDPVIPVGRVSAQFPLPTDSAAPGDVLELTVSFGPSGALVPSFKDLTLDAAQALRAATGLFGRSLRVIDGANTGLVINQSVDAGTLVELGSAVDLVYSTNLMPSVLGEMVPNAIADVLAANLVANDALLLKMDLTPSGTVIAQTPLPDTVVSPLDVVTLTVSLGGLADRFTPSIAPRRTRRRPYL